MKSVLSQILKKLSLKIVLIIIFVGINIYLLTFPSEILGKIIDLMYNAKENKSYIINNITISIIIQLILGI